MEMTNKGKDCRSDIARASLLLPQNCGKLGPNQAFRLAKDDMNNDCSCVAALWLEMGKNNAVLRCVGLERRRKRTRAEFGGGRGNQLSEPRPAWA